MTNLDLANRIIENSTIAFEITHSSSERPSENYLDNLHNKIEEAWTGYLDIEFIKLEEVDDIKGYIQHNITEAIAEEIDVLERYESIAINILLK